MADNIIKDFVKKQTTPLTIGVPRQRPAAEVAQPQQETVSAPMQQVPVEVAPVVEAPAQVTRGHVGRPKSEIEKVKLSVYVPAEAKAKLIRIQHQNFKSSLNDVLMEAISDLVKKYESQ